MIDPEAISRQNLIDATVWPVRVAGTFTEVWQVQSRLDLGEHPTSVAAIYGFTPDQIQACQEYPPQEAPAYMEEFDGPLPRSG